MKRTFILITVFLFSINTIAQSEKDNIIVVQKFYLDTLKTDYRKVKFDIDKKAKKVIRMDYSSNHIADTLIVRNTAEYRFENGHFIYSDQINSVRTKNFKTHKFGDTIFEKIADLAKSKIYYRTKKVYSKNGIIYAARIFRDRQLIPLNERKYIYSKDGELIKIKEKYNSDVREEYKFIFDYSNGIVTRMTEFKKIGNKWKKETIWEYDLITKRKLKKKIKRRINILLLDDQFKNTPW
jgi:hypothetical protein